ncbi:MAG: NfeD family protein, partial [Proteobacteria bacterium]
MDFFAANGPWSWIIAGLVLLALELVLPGGILVWMGIAGIVTGLMLLFQPMGWPWQWLIFGVLSLGSILVWLRYSRNRPPATDRPLLN